MILPTISDARGDTISDPDAAVVDTTVKEVGRTGNEAERVGAKAGADMDNGDETGDITDAFLSFLAFQGHTKLDLGVDICSDAFADMEEYRLEVSVFFFVFSFFVKVVPNNVRIVLTGFQPLFLCLLELFVPLVAIVWSSRSHFQSCGRAFGLSHLE